MQKMNKKKILCGVIVVLATVLLNVYMFHVANTEVGDNVVLNVELSSDQIGEYQVFYGEQDWTEDKSVKSVYEEADKKSNLKFVLPCDLTGFRLDLGTAACEQNIYNIYLTYKDKRWDVALDDIVSWTEREGSSGQIASATLKEDVLQIVTAGGDGHVMIKMPELKQTVISMRHRSLQLRYGLICLLVDLFILILLRHFNRCYELAKEIYVNRKLIYNLSRNDFKTKYAGSFFGMFWAFVQPVITIMVYWFVFSVGFRSPTVDECPFVLWLTAGMVPWFFFSDAWNGATNSLMEYSYLVKKVVFKISILPIVKVASAIYVSIFFHGFMCILFFFHGYAPTIYMIQLVYYLFCVFAISLSISYITCSIIPFFRDLGQIMNIILQILVWMTPIMWNPTIIPQSLRWILKINPIYYIVQGYRDALINKAWFWQDITWTIYFWGLVGALFVIGNMMFKKMRPHFADVL